MPAECIYTNGFVKARHIPRRRAGYERGIYVAAGTAKGKQTNRFPPMIRTENPQRNGIRGSHRERWIPGSVGDVISGADVARG